MGKGNELIFYYSIKKRGFFTKFETAHYYHLNNKNELRALKSPGSNFNINEPFNAFAGHYHLETEIKSKYGTFFHHRNFTSSKTNVNNDFDFTTSKKIATDFVSNINLNYTPKNQYLVNNF